MSGIREKLIDLILEERFGPVVSKVAQILFKHPCTLLQVKQLTELPLPKIKEALCILIKFKLASFQLSQNEITASYKLQIDNVLLMIRYPKFINIIKKKFDEDCEVLIEEIIVKGSATGSELILKVASRLQESNKASVSLTKLKDLFISLVNAKYLIRVENLKDKSGGANESFAIPNIDTQQLVMIMDEEKGEMSDQGVYWTLNPDRFHQDLRDQLVVSAITNKFDENAGELMRLFVQQLYIRTQPWANESNPIPVLEVKDLVKKLKTHPDLITYFDQYVSLLNEDSNAIINKVGDAGGGSYEVQMKEIITQITWEAVESVVNEKFDTKTSRIFRLIKNKKYIELQQIQNLATLPEKAAKLFTYELLDSHFVVINDLRRPLMNSGPNKSFILFYIKLNDVVRSILELCYKVLYNIMTRRQHERSLNKRILDKKQRVETIALGMRAQGATDEQLADIEEMITPPEHELLNSISAMFKKLSMTELEIDDTIFLLETFLRYE